MGPRAGPTAPNSRTALNSVIILNAWTTSGTFMLFYLASLQSISREVYEAAAIDGAGGKNGDPNNALMTMVLYLYNQGFSRFQFGYAAAMTCAMYLITGLVLWLQYRTAVRWRLGFVDVE